LGFIELGNKLSSIYTIHIIIEITNSICMGFPWIFSHENFKITKLPQKLLNLFETSTSVTFY